jgi:hypothetical protein
LVAVGETALAERVASRVNDALQRANELFLDARDGILQDTYDAVSGRMAELYRKMHFSHERQFEARMEPTRAGLRLAVDFLGRGSFPPSALHSEGHQDSMGLCFFLALTERLGGAGLRLVVLDDVVMSVDSSHRRGVADVFASEFPDLQLIVTTHDNTWFRQLRHLSVVGPSTAFEFRGWTLAEGPLQIQDASNPIAAARAALARGDAPGAAASLRRSLEEWLGDVCDALGASVRYRTDGSNEAGEFLQAAIVRYKEVVKKAKVAAQSWKRDLAALNALDEERRVAMTEFEEEAWLVNPTLHYNAWTANVGVADFTPVVDAYERLFKLFYCASCGGLLRYRDEKKQPIDVKCPCGATTLHLQEAPKQQAQLS